MKQRIPEIDVLRGLGIFFVLLGHAIIVYPIMIIPGLSEPPVRTLRATIPENESHIFR